MVTYVRFRVLTRQGECGLVCSHYRESAGLSMVSLVISACIQLVCGRYSESTKIVDGITGY